jgi:hypothetical protein
LASSSLQSSPATIGTPLVDLQLAEGWPSPSWSLAEKTQTPETLLHVPLAQPGGVVGGTIEAQSASTLQVGAAAAFGPVSWVVPPPGVVPPRVVPPGAVPPPLHAPAPSKSPKTTALENEHAALAIHIRTSPLSDRSTSPGPDGQRDAHGGPAADPTGVPDDSQSSFLCRIHREEKNSAILHKCFVAK